MNNNIDVQEVLGSHFCEGNHVNNQTEYYIKKIPARELISKQRIDLVAKYLYVAAQVTGKNKKTCVAIYDEQIKIFTHGSCCEPGNRKKDSLKKYHEVFNLLIESVCNGEFRFDECYIPVGGSEKDLIVLDGAHRVAVNAYFDKEICIVQFPTLLTKYDIEHFHKKHMYEENLDYLKLMYSAITKDLSLLDKEYLKDIYEQSNGEVSMLMGSQIYDNLIKEKYFSSKCIDIFFAGCRSMQGFFIKLLYKLNLYEKIRSVLHRV